MASLGETRQSSGEITSITPKANTRTRRSRNYRTRKGSIAPKDVMPKNVHSIGWKDEEGKEIFIRRTLSLTLGQLRAVCGQLGYLPLNIVSIGAASMDAKSSGAPQVAILYPLAMNKLVRQGREHKRKKKDAIDGDKDDDKDEVGSTIDDEIRQWDPFPTTCWLTCPKLHAQICKLEDKGWISKLESKLQNSEVYTQQMERAHQAYMDYRWALLSPRDQQLVERAKWDKMLKSVGIAGIRVFNAVKCLHCHYAHYLARPADENIIGQWVHELLLCESDPQAIPRDLDELHNNNHSPKNRIVNNSYRDEVQVPESMECSSSSCDDGGSERGADSVSGGAIDLVEEAEGPLLVPALNTKRMSIPGGPFHSPLSEDTIPNTEDEEGESGTESVISADDNEGSVIESTISYIVEALTWTPVKEGNTGDIDGSQSEIDAQIVARIPTHSEESIPAASTDRRDSERMCSVADCMGVFSW